MKTFEGNVCVCVCVKKDGGDHAARDIHRFLSLKC